MRKNALFQIFDKNGNYTVYQFICAKLKDLKRLGQEIADANEKCEVTIESNESFVFFKKPQLL